MAQLCHRRENTCAIGMERLCHQHGTTVPSAWNHRAIHMEQPLYCRGFVFTPLFSFTDLGEIRLVSTIFADYKRNTINKSTI